MEQGIILDNDGNQLTDNCGDEVRLVVTSENELAIESIIDDGETQRRNLVVLDSGVVQLLRDRLNS